MCEEWLEASGLQCNECESSEVTQALGVGHLKGLVFTLRPETKEQILFMESRAGGGRQVSQRGELVRRGSREHSWLLCNLSVIPKPAFM